MSKILHDVSGDWSPGCTLLTVQPHCTELTNNSLPASCLRDREAQLIPQLTKSFLFWFRGEKKVKSFFIPLQICTKDCSYSLIQAAIVTLRCGGVLENFFFIYKYLFKEYIFIISYDI